jgi:hypothetical protein
MSRREGGSHMTSTLGMIGLAGVIGYVVLAAKLGIAFAIPVGVVGFVASIIIFKGPLGQAIITALGGGPPADDTTGQLLAEVDELRGRVQELEERVDFSERLLAQQSKVPER